MAPKAVRQAVGGGCQSGWGRLLSVTNAIEAGAWRQGDSGWAYAGRPGGGGGGGSPHSNASLPVGVRWCACARGQCVGVRCWCGVGGAHWPRGVCAGGAVLFALEPRLNGLGPSLWTGGGASTRRAPLHCRGCLRSAGGHGCVCRGSGKSTRGGMRRRGMGGGGRPKGPLVTGPRRKGNSGGGRWPGRPTAHSRRASLCPGACTARRDGCHEGELSLPLYRGATFSTAPTHQLLGSANAEATPARAPAAAADRTQRPDATCEGENG